MFDEIADPDEIGLKKTDCVLVTVANKLNDTATVFEPDFKEEIGVVKDFDKNLEFATFTIIRDGSDDIAKNYNNAGQINRNAMEITCFPIPPAICYLVFVFDFLSNKI